MLKKTVTYEDPFTNVEVTENLYFNLTKAELVSMEVSIPGDTSLKEHLEAIAEAENGQQIMDAMEWIIFRAYGKRTDDGKFIKNDRLREEFKSSEAYSTMFMEMVTDADKAIEFVSGILPKDFGGDENQEELPVDRPNLTAAPEPIKPRILNRLDMMEMDNAELQSGLASGRYILSQSPE